MVSLPQRVLSSPLSMAIGKMVIARNETEPEYEVPYYPQQTSRKDQGIELTECPAYGVVPT